MPSETKTILVDAPSLLDVVSSMVAFANKGKIDLKVRNLVNDICADLMPGDYASECFACYAWVHQNIRYMRDINNVEFVQEPRKLLESRSGDCDDMATLLAAMLLACGNSCDFVLACFNGSKMPSHVFVQVQTPGGPVPLDPVANFETSQMLQRVSAVKVVRVG